MSREIKFRVWTPDGDMVEWEHFAYDFSILEQEIHHFHFADFFESFQEQGVKFMQYTGLKDKNGVEIYEGDVVGLFLGSQCTSVYWDNDFGGWGIVARPSSTSNMGEELLANHLGTCEVIGNIYENPELLK